MQGIETSQETRMGWNDDPLFLCGERIVLQLFLETGGHLCQILLQLQVEAFSGADKNDDT